MRKLTFGILGLVMTLAALANTPAPAQGQTVCPLCISGYHCCSQNGKTATCVPDSNPCTCPNC